MIAEAATTDRHPIRCDCCGTEVVAILDGNRLIIKQRRHGHTHVAVLCLTERQVVTHTDRDLVTVPG